MIRIEKKDGMKHLNEGLAILSMTSLQINFAMDGYLTTTHIDTENHVIILTVHFEGKKYPTVPYGYSYTSREIRSHEYYNETDRKVERIRVVEFIYEYEH